MHEAAQHAGDRDDADRIARVAARFADESLGVGLTLDQITRAGTEGLRRARDAGPNTVATLAAAVEREIRRSIPAEHQGLVGDLANYFTDRARRVGLGFDDLYLEGQLGLIRAARLYEPEKGFRFSTYANPWVRSFMADAILNEPRIARVPIYLHTEIAGVKARHGASFEQYLGENARAAMRIGRTRLIREIEDRGQYESGATFRLDAIEDRHGEGWADDDLLASLLATLDAKERSLIAAYYGIGRRPQLYREIAEQAGRSRWHVRERLKVVLGKLREEIERRGLSCADCLAS